MSEIPPLNIPSSAVRVQRPRISRIFSVAFAIALLSPALSVLLVALAAALHLPSVRWPAAGMGDALAWTWVLGTPALAILSAISGAWAPARAGRLSVSAAGVTVVRGGARRTIAAADIEAGLLVPTRTGATEVELHLRDGRLIRASVESEDDARAMLDRLGLGPDRRRVAATMGNPNRWMAAGCMTFAPSAIAGIVALILAMIYDVHPLPALILGSMVASFPPILVFLAARPATVVVGADAVMVRRPFATRVIPLSDIQSVGSLGADLKIQLRADAGRDGEDLITVAGTEAALAAGIAARIREAIVRRGSGEGALAAGDLDPGDRSFADWRASLSTLLKRGADYRRAALGAEDLLAVVDDAAAPPARRIGAAIALRDGDHPEARARVRIAADTCADEETRAALAAAAAEEEMEEEPIRRVIERRWEGRAGR